MTKKVAAQVFIPVVLVLLAVVPATVTAQEGEGEMAGEAMMAAVSCQQDYTVQADDWLSKIADKFYGDVLAFPAIVEATNTHHDAAMMAGDEAMMAEGDKTMMAEGDETMMAGEKLMLQGSDGQMMNVTMEADGTLMVEGADGQMMAVMMGEDGHLMAADGSMVDGKLMVEGADGQMMEVTMMDGELMTTGADGEMMDVATADKGMAGETMVDTTMAGEETMMAGGYALIDNADIIEPGWVLCIPSPEDAQKLLGDAEMMAQ